MRLDVFLKTSRLISRRSMAQEFCDKGLIEVNGVAAKSSKEVRAGDFVKIKRNTGTTTVEISNIPTGKQVSKSLAVNLYRVVSDDTQVPLA